ncbi:uncharacterized protein LOC115797451 [Archocentrus centrarchus]|uniref:uncharacterized protein LOC115797451 n=1 Tax=Archocentrus centrarchus TaxID=63155 RepID=UPI0011EA1DB5|nr:uncharacterized protein LOC115797451 [Archocentrus centrarchus]
MDPAPSFLLEMDPNDRGNHAQSGAPVFPQVYPQNPHQRLSAEGSPSKEKPDVHETRSMQMPRKEVTSYQKKQAVQHFPAQVSPTHAQAQASSISVNFLPATYPPPPHLQALSPGAVPQFLCPPCFPPLSYWLPPALPHGPSYSFGFSPYMLHPFSNPPEFWCNPGLLPPILCPQIMPIHQTCAADQASGSMQIHVTPASERSEGDQRSMNHVKEDQKSKLQESNPGNEIKIADFPEPSSFWNEELMKEDGFEECMARLDFFFDELLPAQAKETGEEECGEAGALNLENSSLLEYVGELCSDPEFVSKVESILDNDTLIPPLSSDQDPLEVFTQGERKEELPPLPANSAPLPEETAPATPSYEKPLQSLFLAPAGIPSAASPKQNSPKMKDWIRCAPLLPSHLLEEPPTADAAAEGPVEDPFPPPEESQTPLDACSAPSHNDNFMSMVHLFPDTSKVSDLESDDRLDNSCSFLNLRKLKIKTTPPPVESPSTSRMGPSVSADDLSFAVHSDPDSFNLPVKSTLSELESEKQTEKPAKPRREAQGEMKGKRVEMRGPQRQQVMKGGEKKAGRKTLEKEEKVRMDNKIKVKPSILIRSDQRVLDKRKQKKDGERKTSEENRKKTTKLTPKRNEAEQQKRREKQLFKRKEGDKRSQKTKITSTAEQLLEMAKKDPKAEAGKQGEPSNPTFYSGTRVNRTLFSTPKRGQPTPTARSKTKHSQEDREQTGKSSPEGEVEGMKQEAKDFVLQNVNMISPVKRSRSMRGEEVKAGAAKIREKTVSAHPTKERKAPLDEGCKPGSSSSCRKSTSANTSVTTSGSPTAQCRKSKNVFEGTIWNMRPQIQPSTASSPKPSPGAGVQDDKGPRGECPSLTGSPVKRLREKWEATGERGQSADNMRMENEQLGPKKSTKRKHEGTKKSKGSKQN